MRERIKDIVRLRHIDECIDHVMDFLQGRSFEDMKKDVMCYHAVVYNIMVIGEAANMLTKDFCREHPKTPWRDIVDMRNVLIHGYHVASPLFIWETYTKDLPVLKAQLREYITELSDSEK